MWYLVDFPPSKETTCSTCYLDQKSVLEFMLIFIKQKVIISQPSQQEIILNGIMPFLAKKGPFDLKKYGDT